MTKIDVAGVAICLKPQLFTPFYQTKNGCYNRSCHNTKRFNRKRKSVEHVIHPQTDPADSTCFCGVEFTNWKDLLDHVSLNHTEMRTMEEEGKDAACDNFSEGTIEEAEKMQEDSSKERIERLKMQEDSWMENKKQLSITGGGGIEPIIIDDSDENDSDDEHVCRRNFSYNPTEMCLNDYQFLKIPPVMPSKVTSFRICDMSNSCHLADDAPTMPHKNQLEDIKAQMQSRIVRDPSINIHVRLDTGCYSIDQINRFLFLHYAKTKQQDLFAMNLWVNSKPLSPTDSVDWEQIQAFSNMLFSLKPSQQFPVGNNNSVSVSELQTMTNQKWFEGSVLNAFASMINEQYCNIHAFMMPLTFDAKKYVSNLYKRFGPNPLISCDKLIFFLHVGTQNDFVFLNSYGHVVANHYALAVFYPKSNKLCYADTLAWDCPREFKNHLRSVLKGLNCPDPVYIHLHDPHFVTENSVHVCSNNCTSYYPLQSCSSVCGPATLIGACIATYYEKDISSVFSSPNELSYLKNISNYSDFVRLILINWLMKHLIDITQLFSKSSQPTANSTTFSKISRLSRRQRHKRSTESNNTLASSELKMSDSYIAPKKSKSVLTTAKSKSTPILNNESTLESTPISNYESAAILTNESTPISNSESAPILTNESTPESTPISNSESAPILTNESTPISNSESAPILTIKSTPESTPISNNESTPESTSSILNPQSSLTLNSAEPLTSHINGSKTTISHRIRRGKHYLEVAFHSTGSKTKYKSFHCTDQGTNDQVAIDTIKKYLNNQNPLSDEWVENGEVMTGADTKYYFDRFTFDFTKTVRLHKNVRPSFVGNQTTMKASLTLKKNWQTHRLDNKFEFIEPIVEDTSQFVAAEMLIKCSSKSSVCKSSCGYYLSKLNMSSNITNCPSCQIDVVLNDKQCIHCSITMSNKWRKNADGETLCSNCYNYKLKNKRDRPVKLRQQFEPKKLIHPHFMCYWATKLVLFSTDLSKWRIFSKPLNGQYHDNIPLQIKKRPNLSTRDRWDENRVMMKATAMKVLSATNAHNNLHVSNVNDGAGHDHTLDQISNRLKYIDKSSIKLHMKSQDEIPILSSDWRNTEKLLEGNYESVLLFQRGDATLKRNYHIILSDPRSLEHLSNFGQSVIGIDVKHDFNSWKFKTSFVTFADNKNEGRIAAASISSDEGGATHATTIQLVLANTPCKDEKCNHPSEFYIFNDGNGFFRIKPCSSTSRFCPFVQHDKDASLKQGASDNNLKSVLCNFHVLQCIRRFMNENQELRLFCKPLETGFKCIMRSWDASSRTDIANSFISFIENDISLDLMSQDTKTLFIDYLKKNWFNSQIWSDAFNAESIYQSDQSNRNNPLLLTDNITERKFKQIDDVYLSGHLNKLISSFVRLLFENVFNDEIKATNMNNLQFKQLDQRVKNIRHLEKIEKCCKRAFDLLQNNEILKYDEETNWFVVKSSSRKNLNRLEDNDNFFNGDTQYTFNQLDVLEERFPDKVSISEEHSYDISKKCRRYIGNLDSISSRILFNYVITIVPENCLSYVDGNCHLINLKLGICTCEAFIMIGQPYFCKHLFACFAQKNNITTTKALIDAYKFHIVEPLPTYNFTRQNISVSSTLIDKLKDHSHIASSNDINAARKGHILSILHNESHCGIKLISGRPAKRQPHNMAHRRAEGPIKDNQVAINLPELEVIDPYCPKVTMPKDAENARHGGRKIIRPANRGVSFSAMVENAAIKLGKKAKISEIETIDSTDPDPGNDIEFSADILSQNKSSLPKKSKDTKPKDIKSIPVVKNDSKSVLFEKSIVCSFCIKDKINPPYLCSCRRELDRHISTSHSSLKPISCAICWADGVINSYASETFLQKHIRIEHNHHKKKSIVIDYNNRDDYLNSSPITEINNSNSEKELEILIDQPGNAGLQNLAKLKLDNLLSSKVEKTPSRLVAETCPVCHKNCNANPKKKSTFSIECDNCHRWYHWKCAPINEAPPEHIRWFCFHCDPIS
ncbi:uncharacterized protein LOC141914437 isoform X2 [Tubulanus polymorphus]